MIEFIQTITAEMCRGNFSFLILVVGLAQLGAMMRRSRKSIEKGR